MSRTVSNQDRVIVTRKTEHEAFATAPDTCKVPGSPAPKPFANWVKSDKLAAGATTTVLIDGAAVWTAKGELGPPSDPPHAGSAGGVKSGTYRGEAKPTSYSPDVMIEGSPAVRAFDTTTQNHANTVGLVVPAELAGMLRQLAGIGEECLARAAESGAAFISR